MRTPAWCRQQAEKIGPATAAVIDELMEVNAIHRLRSAQGIIGLAGRPGIGTGPAGGGLRPGAGRRRPVLPHHQGHPRRRQPKHPPADRTAGAAADAPAFLRGPDELLA